MPVEIRLLADDVRQLARINWAPKFVSPSKQAQYLVKVTGIKLRLRLKLKMEI